jgi:exodeoxyribonuclease VII large subunit
MPLDERDYFTVTEINNEARTILEESYHDVRVMGEISNFKRHSSGHLYFTLKDSDCQLRAVCFRSDANRLRFEPEDGIKAVARGRLTVYDRQGQYQMVASTIVEAGAGELEAAFRALKEKLEKEGLFDPAHKKPLPPYPFRVAVVTSRTGAAVRDVVSTLGRRWPCVEILLVPVHVQGEQAAPDIVRALQLLRETDHLDLIILGRGGGSLEDLWAFNEEAVARAIFECPVPIISAVGHETDVTIADFVADVRAATPTMAAEVAVPERDEIHAALVHSEERLLRHMHSGLELRRRRLSELLRSYALGRIRGRIENYLQTHDHMMDNLKRRVAEALDRRRARLNEAMVRLKGLDARAILDRGYSICTDPASGRVVGSVAGAIEAGDLRVTFRDGNVITHVKENVDERG